MVVHYCVHRSQARPSSEQQEVELLGPNVYDDAAMRDPSALSHEARQEIDFAATTAGLIEFSNCILLCAGDW